MSMEETGGASEKMYEIKKLIAGLDFLIAISKSLKEGVGEPKVRSYQDFLDNPVEMISSDGAAGETLIDTNAGFSQRGTGVSFAHGADLLVPLAVGCDLAELIPSGERIKTLEKVRFHKLMTQQITFRCREDWFDEIPDGVTISGVFETTGGKKIYFIGENNGESFPANEAIEYCPYAHIFGAHVFEDKSERYDKYILTKLIPGGIRDTRPTETMTGFLDYMNSMLKFANFREQIVEDFTPDGQRRGFLLGEYKHLVLPENLEQLDGTELRFRKVKSRRIKDNSQTLHDIEFEFTNGDGKSISSGVMVVVY